MNPSDQAFPGKESENYYYTGLTVRDYVAIGNLQAILTRDGLSFDKANHSYHAALAYEYADALIAKSNENVDK